MKKSRGRRIKADLSRQVPTNSYAPPEYYRDDWKRCIDCKAMFLFTAEEQLAWHEEYRIPHYATAIRCKNCRQKFKFRGKLKQQYEKVVESLKSNFEHPALNMEFGKLALLQRESGVNCRLEPAIAALRKALALNSRLVESHYWLGRCYEAMENTKKAMDAYSDFVNKVESRKKGELKTLIVDAQKRITGI